VSSAFTSTARQSSCRAIRSTNRRGQPASGDRAGAGEDRSRGEYFIKRKLYPNVDFHSGLIYEAFQFPSEMFTVLFAIGRTPGWVAEWLELVQDPDQNIARPQADLHR